MTNPPNTGQKLTFRIVDFSGEDPQYPVTELLSGSPQSKGWQSQRFCDWPQYITFQFFGPVRLKQLQFLSHQCKISSKIELFTALPNLRSPAPDPDLKFKKLGYLSLDSNERSGYQSRELKTVYIDSVCLYLKITLQKCHLNKFNLFNQVGLIAVGIFGDPVSSTNPTKEVDANKAKYERLEYETQYDSVTVQKMKELEDAKAKAIEREDFDEAKRIKQAIERMKHLGAQLQHLEESKAKAIKNEDYDSAKIIKQEIDRLREAIAPSSLGRQQVRDTRDRPQQHVQFSEDEPIMVGNRNRVDSPERRQGGLRQSEDEGRNKMSQERNHREEHKQEVRRQEPPQAPHEDRHLYQPVAHDEQVIPTMQNRKQDQFEDEHPPAKGGTNNNIQQEVEPLTAQNRKLAEPLIPVIGEDLACRLFSKVWNIREDGLKTLESEITGKGHVINKSDPGAVFIAVMGAIAHTINDKVNQVVLKSLGVLQTLLNQNPPHISSKTELNAYVEGTMTGLLEKIGDNNARVRELAENSLMGMAHHPVITCSFCVNSLVKNVNPTKHKTAGSTKHLVGRLTILRQIVKEFKINTKDVPYEPVVTYAADKLENSSPEVRSAASSLLVDIYSIVGERLKGDLSGVRQNQLELLMKEFDAIGGGGRGYEEPPVEKKPVVTTNINAQGAKKGTKGEPPGKAGNSNTKAPQVQEEGPACDFCERTDKNLADPKKMDIHLWKECPMLTTCENCVQIVEISQLNKHLLEECDNKKMIRKCPRCKEAVHMDEYKQHTEEMSCLAFQPASKFNRCPLCHQDIAAGDVGWKKHLLGEGCPNNERTM